VARSADKQVTVRSSLLQGRRVNGISLLVDFPVGGVFLDEAGHPRVLGTIGDAVEHESGGKCRDGDVEAWL
jgi:hypothetical protein